MTAARVLTHVAGQVNQILLRGEDGQDLMEYALLAALISPLVIFTIILIGPQLSLMFQDVVNAFLLG